MQLFSIHYSPSIVRWKRILAFLDPPPATFVFAESNVWDMSRRISSRTARLPDGNEGGTSWIIFGSNGVIQMIVADLSPFICWRDGPLDKHRRRWKVMRCIGRAEFYYWDSLPEVRRWCFRYRGRTSNQDLLDSRSQPEASRPRVRDRKSGRSWL
jgi:hypothetical protein